jgi:NAD(P)-dependent dehydrogenase (short-subunit alcohol dehydrogenase family)
VRDHRLSLPFYGAAMAVGWAAAFLASDEARWITGATLPVVSGVLSVTPLMMAPHLRSVAEPES